jgi:type IV secretory pathway VirD2 relaxase
MPGPTLSGARFGFCIRRTSVKGNGEPHGCYIARESAADRGVGFDGDEESIDIATRLEGWQKANDERLWKLIVSPEFGDRVDLKRLTRDLMSEMQTDLGMPLQWVAVAHFNTEHPHVHVALRGVGTDDRTVRLSRDFIREGIRHIAEDRCTHHLGFRTEFDAAQVQRREVHQQRYTPLDRIIQRDADTASSTKDPSRAGIGSTIPLTERRTAERLMFLGSMGLAESTGPKSWRVRRDFEIFLRAMQRSGDWQKTLAAHGVLRSDERLQ